MLQLMNIASFLFDRIGSIFDLSSQRFNLKVVKITQRKLDLKLY